MKARPQGASVVPTVATATSTRVAVQRHAGDDQPRRGRAPVGVGEDPGDDVGDEDRAQREQQVLDSVEVLAQDEERRRRLPPAAR